jgi:hypothetical protein
MALSVISENIRGMSGQVIIRGETLDEVTSAEAKSLAIQRAVANGLNRPGLSGVPQGYPVNAQGEFSTELALGQAGKPAAYQADYAVAGMP